MARDLTIIYTTANRIKEKLRSACEAQLLIAAQGIPIISVSKKPIALGQNIVASNPEASFYNMFRETMLGVEAAKTKWIAIAEDDVLYSPEHFKITPKRDDGFTYNVANWHLYTWLDPAMFSHRERQNMYALIAPRDLYLKAMEERYAKYPNESDVPIKYWTSPGRAEYERKLGVTEYPAYLTKTHPPNVVFLHDNALGRTYHGTRLRPAEIRAFDVPYWGRADKLIKYTIGE